jgi:hypothetical protein
MRGMKLHKASYEGGVAGRVVCEAILPQKSVPLGRAARHLEIRDGIGRKPDLGEGLKKITQKNDEQRAGQREMNGSPVLSHESRQAQDHKSNSH